MASRTIPITLTWNSHTRHWFANSGEPYVRAAAPSTALAERALRTELARELGERVKVKTTLLLTSEIRALIEDASTQRVQPAPCQDELAQRTANVAWALFGTFGMRKKEIAHCLGITTRYVGHLMANFLPPGVIILD